MESIYYFHKDDPIIDIVTNVVSCLFIRLWKYAVQSFEVELTLFAQSTA